MEHELKLWLEEQKQDVSEVVIKLIEEDAPKNKFSIQAGKLRMLEDIQSWMDKFEQSRKS